MLRSRLLPWLPRCCRCCDDRLRRKPRLLLCCLPRCGTATWWCAPGRTGMKCGRASSTLLLTLPKQLDLRARAAVPAAAGSAAGCPSPASAPAASTSPAKPSAGRSGRSQSVMLRPLPGCSGPSPRQSNMLTSRLWRLALSSPPAAAAESLRSLPSSASAAAAACRPAGTSPAASDAARMVVPAVESPAASPSCCSMNCTSVKLPMPPGPDCCGDCSADEDALSAGIRAEAAPGVVSTDRACCSGSHSPLGSPRPSSSSRAAAAVAAARMLGEVITLRAPTDPLAAGGCSCGAGSCCRCGCCTRCP